MLFSALGFSCETLNHYKDLIYRVDISFSKKKKQKQKQKQNKKTNKQTNKKSDGRMSTRGEITSPRKFRILTLQEMNFDAICDRINRLSFKFPHFWNFSI